MAQTLPLLIAHRGGSLEAPENTLAAFRYAVELGVPYVELDVQMTRDGELVVIHDETLDRTTNGSGLVRDYTLEELRRFDAGSKFSHLYRGEPVPTLREIMELCVGAGVGVVVELKSPHLNPGLEEKVAAMLGEMWLRGADNIYCISFDHESIRKMRALDPAVPLGYLFEWNAESFVLPGDTVQAFCPYYKSALARPDQVEEAHRMGKFVFVYTVNDAAEMHALSDAGIDGMVSDRPSLLLETLGKRK
jgi:glycerophosphoryl diester phosphodiesterase